MALSDLEKYAYKHTSQEIIRRGKTIFATKGVILMSINKAKKTASFKVTNDEFPTTYEVVLAHYNDAGKLETSCKCSYSEGDICRHRAAAIFFLINLLDTNELASDKEYDQSNTIVKMRDIDPKILKLLTSNTNYEEAEKIAKSKKIKLQAAEEEQVTAELKYQKESFDLAIQRLKNGNYLTACSCNEQKFPLCKHKTALFLYLLKNYGEYYFDIIKNWDKQKNVLLAQYGYSLSDNLKGKFDFSYKNGKPFLRVLDPSIKKLNKPAPSISQNGLAFEVRPKPQPAAPKVEEKAIVLPQGVRSRHLEEAGGIKQFLKEESDFDENVQKRLGVLIDTADDEFPFVRLGLLKGKPGEGYKRFQGNVRILDISRYVDYYSYLKEDRNLISPIRKISKPERAKYLTRNSAYDGLWENLYVKEGEENKIPPDTQKLLLKYVHSRLNRLFPVLKGHDLVFEWPKKESLNAKALKPIKIEEKRLRPEFEIKEIEGGMTIRCFVHIDGKRIPIEENQSKAALFFKKEDRLFLINSVNSALIVAPYLKNNPLFIPKADWVGHLKEYVLPLTEEYVVDFPETLVKKAKKEKPQFCIKFTELNSLLLIQPLFRYKTKFVEWNRGKQITAVIGDKLLLIERDKEAENAFIEKILKSHKKLKRYQDLNYFHLNSKYALDQNWFLHFIKKLKEENVLIKGLESLKKFRFNPNKPVTKLELSSNIDWFDARVEVAFGNQFANIKDIKKALSRRQNYVPLEDGTLGILPEKWIEKYGLFFRIGKKTKTGLRVSKYNFSIIDELHDHIDDEKILKELDEKKNMLFHYNELPPIPVPKQINSTLRRYQKSGLQWLAYLDKIKWGGILADDMGLGKTLQTLTFLQYFKNENKQCFALVVCPTSLMYNWENELEKFAPDLSFRIHHGQSRTYNTKILKRYNILLTSYGTLRSDIQLLSKLEFNYVILDESQFIKNPHSKVTKAAKLLQAENRVCLTGTPMQNNTFDIYSQMDFLNPGMLGSIDFFKSEFSHPIDGGQDADQMKHLRKLIYPFLLRRTKEQVAPDLPEKSEMVLYCEMGKEQKEIYEYYRNLYRSRILGTIHQQGLKKSQLTILQGLMKLRQICDSPAILKDESYKNHSVKIDELTRELQENVRNHKVLIFSQFLGMMELIRKKLRKLDIPYVHFDGSTTPADREKAIYSFQNDKKTRVFIISLKAGGVGLNLTAADYVYIVDPWWNPAVEQQAIDRTHRIGQTKNIFAYRMICKDTIEEKILKLQERKNALVKDIIAEEGSFIKKLSQEDVEYLFS